MRKKHFDFSNFDGFFEILIVIHPTANKTDGTICPAYSKWRTTTIAKVALDKKHGKNIKNTAFLRPKNHFLF